LQEPDVHRLGRGHFGDARAARWLRKAYGWYLHDKQLLDALHRTESVSDAKAVLAASGRPAAVSAAA